MIYYVTSFPKHYHGIVPLTWYVEATTTAPTGAVYLNLLRLQYRCQRLPIQHGGRTVLRVVPLECDVASKTSRD